MPLHAPIAAPEDAAAFIADAEAITNRRDRHAQLEVFAPTARWTVLIDGLQFTAVGHGEIQTRWAQLCDFMDRRGMIVDKHVIVRDARTIVSGWIGHCPDGTVPVGYEIWRFDHHGKVIEQTLTGYLDPVYADSIRGAARYLRSSPRDAATFALSRLTSLRSTDAH